jgi:hypothetical protein
VICTTLPGARLLHQGQFEGKRTRIPVFLGRGPTEREDGELAGFYSRLLQAIRNAGGLRGEWSLRAVNGWPDNQSCRNLLAWSWMDGDARTLVVVNYSGAPAQGIVEMGWPDLSGATWRLVDPLADQLFDREGADMQEHGLYVQLEPWGTHFFHVSVVSPRVAARQPRRASALGAAGPSSG